MGGILKDCEPCDGTGKVDADDISVECVDENEKQRQMAETIERVAEVYQGIVSTGQTLPKKRAKDHSEDPLHMVELVSAAQAFESMGVPKSVIKEVITQDLSEATDAFPAPIDELMVAILDEPRMDPLEWAAKYRHVDRLFGKTIDGRFDELCTKVQRAAMRANYATGQVIADRVVNLSASQDAVSKSDPEFVTYQAKEKKLMAEKKKKAVK